ncbi:MAG: DUF4340 domain-containing protein [Alphaproteobacteria bacterium]|nr:DUF4340 domain-containing protein [Alphaproteobacteria bacterium]
MRTKSALVLAATAVVVLALGLEFGMGPREKSYDTSGGTLVFPDLTGRLATAVEIDIVHAGRTLKIARKTTDPSAVWGIVDHNAYPAQASKVRELLTGLTELRYDEPRTSEAAEYPRLGVEDPSAKGSDSTLVRVLDASGPIAQLIVGHQRTSATGNGQTLYVRRPNEVQAWLADGALPVSADVMEWLNRDLVNIPADEIEGVTVDRGGQKLVFARKDKTLTLTDPAEHPKLDEYKLEDIGRGLENLSLEDVRPAPAPGNALGKAVFTTRDGTSVTVDVSKAGPAVWATFAAQGKHADALGKLKGWAYEIGSWKEKALVPTLDDLKAAVPAASSAPIQMPGHVPMPTQMPVPMPAPPPAPAAPK